MGKILDPQNMKK